MMTGDRRVCLLDVSIFYQNIFAYHWSLFSTAPPCHDLAPDHDENVL